MLAGGHGLSASVAWTLLVLRTHRLACGGRALNGSCLGYTNEDGAYGEVDISAATVGVAQVAVQQCIDAYSWSGPPRTIPD